MPINIYKQDSTEIIAWLCENVWDLPNQISELYIWLKNNTDKLPKSDYVIDVGFDIRPNATGGGAVINLEMLKIMSEKGFELYLSEYPNQLNNQ